MSAVITKVLFDPYKNRQGVNYSYKRPVLEFEMNEEQAIYNHKITQTWLATRGAGPVGDAFLVEPGDDPNSIRVRSGFLMLKTGQLLAVKEDAFVTSLTTPVGPRTDYVYLDYAIEEETALMSPELLDNTVLGPGGLPFGETATRDRVTYTLNVSEGATPPAPAAGHNIYLLAQINRSASPTIISSEVVDKRVKWAASFFKSGIKVKRDPLNPLKVTWDAGAVSFMGTSLSVAAGTYTFSGGITEYLYVNNLGVVTAGMSLPHWNALPLVKVTTSVSTIDEILDLRVFGPSAGGGGSGAGSTSVEYNTLDNLTVGDAVYLSTASSVALADNSAPSTTPAIGLAGADALTGNLATVVVTGEVENPAWSWTPGLTMYLDTNGGLTQTKLPNIPANEGKVWQRIGVAITATKVLVSPDIDRIIIGSDTNSISYGERLYFLGDPVAGDVFWFERVDVDNNSGDLQLHLEDEADGSEKFSIWSGGAVRHEFRSDGTVEHTGSMVLGSLDTDLFENQAITVETDERTVEYTYDLSGRIASRIEKDGLTTVRTITYNYVGASTRVDTAVETVGTKTITYTYSYDLSGNLTSRTKAVV